ncbi:outer membrane beta-barrel protein [Desulfoluna butyratoxydans]|uniref:Outer membrane protein/outer membrane enzyme pagp beta-barrel n=1 Tax=Desulfoluna butyratoxydans TaxID=231438 RepID=A0A4V6IKT9_9BACT|nr:outer membrane beta-barrel protein [Desulfoluna butyratoxydans]VFQ42508.1 outer membrane protein/outer membrane enzyme pagp beta-barrel [Desulfoluna butyratoxydans]
MRRITLLSAAILVMLGSTALAESGPSFRISAGPTMLFDPSTQEAGLGGHVTLGYQVASAWEIELYGATSDHFEMENNLTRGDASISLVTLGGRYLSSFSGKTRGFIAFGAGVMEIEAEDAPSGEDDTQSGGIGRFGVGIDHAFIPNLGVTFGAGFNRGFGDTDEVVLYDLTFSVFCAF